MSAGNLCRILRESEDQRDLCFCNDWRLLSADPDDRKKVERENFFRGTYGSSCRFPELFDINSRYLGTGISFVGIPAVEPFKQYELFQNGR